MVGKSLNLATKAIINSPESDPKVSFAGGPPGPDGPLSPLRQGDYWLGESGAGWHGLGLLRAQPGLGSECTREMCTARDVGSFKQVGEQE